MNENIEYLSQNLETDLKDSREMVQNDDDRVMILTLIREHMIPQLQEMVKEV